mmetsp:Transcript_47945/g.71407  ORF Transcript_47945/g.71407 Transcript_47945/m.71407 type:complete len:113 (-) Transcript_47945:1344-1682(-)
MVTAEQFQTVAGIVGDKSVKPKKSASNAEKTRLYGLYKRGTVGKLNGPYGDEDTETDKRPKSRPGMLKVEARAKYDGWAAVSEEFKSLQEAMDAYCKLAEEIVGEPVTKALA